MKSIGTPDTMVKIKILWNAMDTCEIFKNYTISLQMTKNKEYSYVDTKPQSRSKERKLNKLLYQSES